MRRKQKLWVKDLAKQRIARLFELAHHEFHNHPERSNRYVRLARSISMRYRVRIPKELKQRMCKHCYSYLVQGVNARTRLHGTHISITCLGCGKQMRQPY